MLKHEQITENENVLIKDFSEETWRRLHVNEGLA
jgi:hypothetical protein